MDAIFDAFERFDPFGHLQPCSSASGIHSSIFGSGFPFMGSSAHMKVDLHETDSGFVLSAELPGIRKQDIKVDFNENSNLVRISGECEKQDNRMGGTGGTGGDKKYYYAERCHGKVSRCVCMPNTADTRKAVATFEDGVMKLTFPKRPAPPSRRRRIPITDGAGSGSA